MSDGGKLWAVDFRVLGPIEARAEGRPLPVAGARQRALLAVLLLRAGEPVSRERLIADLWGERPPAGAVKTVQAVVSRLRRALGSEAARLVSSAAGYRLRVEPDELDLSRFERLCGEGRRALAAGRHERAAARLRAALAEWRGPPLADVALEPFAPPEVARLEDLRAAAVEDRVEADLALLRGPAREAPPEAERRRATATILCAEPAGFAAVGASLEDADVDRVRGEYDGRARDVLAAHGATAVKAVGDGLLAAFSTAGDA